VQRFGSKLGLLRAVAAQLTEASAELFDAIRGDASSPLEAVRAYAECMARMGGSPGALAHHLAWLQLDLTDEAMRRHLRTQAAIARDALGRWVADAIESGELARTTDAAGLARSIQVTISGSLLGSAFDDGSAVASMRRDLEALLRPWLRRNAEGDRGARATPRRRRKGRTRAFGPREERAE
jgi:AcrR family transcriptional regulator